MALLLCRSVAKAHDSSSVEAYAQDHWNDVLTNLVGVVAVLLAWWQPNHLAILDPIGAVCVANAKELAHVYGSGVLTRGSESAS